MMRFAHTIALTLFIFACETALSPPALSSRGADCTLPRGWSAIAARRPRYIIFGEVHGTQQAPAFVENVACALARRGEHILVAVEHSSTANHSFRMAWALPDDQFEAAILKTDWAGRDDGVASIAMLTMLEKLHKFNEQTGRISVVAFNGLRDSSQERRFHNLLGQGPHEAAQAENIREAANGGAFDQVLVLVGRGHARKRPAEDGGAIYQPMAMQLSRQSEVISLDMKFSSGSMWNCLLKPGHSSSQQISRSDVDCADHRAGGDPALHKPPFVGLGAFPGKKLDPDYDGFYWLGPVSGSPPARP